MQCYGDDPDQTTGRTRPAPPEARVDWHGAAVLLGLALLLLAMLWVGSGCAPLNGPAGPRVATPEPERGLAGVPLAAAAIPPELDRVSAAGQAIRREVAGMVPAVREIAAVAPLPAARVTAGHQTIYAEAQAAETAASTARQQVAAVTASAAEASAELERLRQAHAREVEALGQRVAQAEQERDRLRAEQDGAVRQLARWGQVLGGLLIAAGAGLIFLLRGAIALPLAVAAAGATLLALATLLHRLAPWLPWIGGGLLVGLIGLAGWYLRRESQARALTTEALAGAVGFGQKMKQLAPAEVEVATEWAKANVSKAARDEIWNHLPNKE